jgi:predicted nucleic acid-binding protein
MSAMQNSPISQIVIDASTAMGALLPTLAPVDTLDHFVAWRQAGVAILAPPLFLAECTSVVRRYVHSALLTADEAVIALDDLAALDVTIIPDTFARCRAAYDCATRLGQVRAYDGFYLALAQEISAPLYTGDKRLVNAGRQNGIDSIIWVGDA